LAHYGIEKPSGAALASLFEEGDPTLSGCPVIFLIVRQGFEITCKPGAGIWCL